MVILQTPLQTHLLELSELGTRELFNTHRNPALHPCFS